MANLYETRVKDGVEEVYMGEGEWVSTRELNEVFQDEIRGRQLLDAADVLAEREVAFDE